MTPACWEKLVKEVNEPISQLMDVALVREGAKASKLASVIYAPAFSLGVDKGLARLLASLPSP